jgi:hypothetical protein
MTIGLCDLIKKPIFDGAALPRHQKSVLYFTAKPIAISSEYGGGECRDNADVCVGLLGVDGDDYAP